MVHPPFGRLKGLQSSARQFGKKYAPTLPAAKRFNPWE